MNEIREKLIQSNSSDISYEKALDTLKEKYLKELQHPFVKDLLIIAMESLNAATVDQVKLPKVLCRFETVSNNLSIARSDVFNLRARFTEQYRGNRVRWIRFSRSKWIPTYTRLVKT